MSEITLAEVRNAFIYLTVMTAITFELTKANSNAETTLVLINRLELDSKKKREYFSELHMSCKKSLENLKNELLGIAGTFGETESKVFMKLLMEKKDSISIAKDLNLSEEYVRHVVSSVKKKASQMFNEHYEVETLNKLFKDIKEIQNGDNSK